MNEKTRAQIEAMKNQTIGVEVEMNNITREKAAKKAAEFFGTGRYEYTAGRNGYCTWSAWDAQGREWKFQRDVSIEGSDSEKCEMVTPVLTYGDIGMLQQLHREGHTVVLITHDNSIAVQADRIIRLEDGRVVYDGDSHAPEAMVQPTLLPETPEKEEQA